MRFLTNPASNLPAELVRLYDIALAPQKIVVDGVEHDTRAQNIPLSRVDEWVRGAKEHPHVLGSSAAQFADLYRQIAERDREIVAIMTAKKFIGSYTAAVAAARTFTDRSTYADMQIHVVDSTMTDLATGLATLYAALAARDGLAAAKVALLAESFCRGGVFCFVPETLDNLVKGGSASFLRALFANVLNLSPVIGIVDGENKVLDKISRKADVAPFLTERAVAALGPGRPVWCGIMHGDAPDKAERVAQAVKAAFDVRYLLVRPLSPSVYLHAGPRAIGLFVAPIDRLAWTARNAPG